MALSSKSSRFFAKASADIFSSSSGSRWIRSSKASRSSMVSILILSEFAFGRTRYPLGTKKVLELTRSLNSAWKAFVLGKVSSLDAAVIATKTQTSDVCKTWPTNLTASLWASRAGSGYIRRKESSMGQVMSDHTPSLSFQSASMTMLRYQSH